LCSVCSYFVEHKIYKYKVTKASENKAFIGNSSQEMNVSHPFIAEYSGK
jgi:hypothetical protein